MMIKIGSEYLDFNESVELERKAKLLEEISSTEGDVSFQFEVYLSNLNVMLLEFPFPDNVGKRVYKKIDADLLSDDGSLIASGYIRVENVNDPIAYCSFWSGNSNWFAMLTGNLTDLNLDQYDMEQTETNIFQSWDNTEGIVWPLIDTGMLSTRSYQSTKVEDYVPCFYVKTLFKQLFQQSGLKIDGELLSDWRYNNMMIAANGRSGEEKERRGAFVLKNTVQALTDTYQVITFDDDTNYPYYDGAQDNFDLANSRYVADIKMTVRVSVSVTTEGNGVTFIKLVKNGTTTQKLVGALFPTTAFDVTISLEAGDYIDIQARVESLFPAVDNDVQQATLRIEPIYLYKAFGGSAVPKWTKQQLVSNVLNLFNVITSYDPFTKTVTFNIFDKLKDKEAIDISEYIESTTVDYSDFISDYGRKNNFLFQETDIENLNEYNISTFINYGAGVIEVDNDFIEESVEVIESDFASPISYLNGPFDMSMERIQFVETSEGDNSPITSVSDASGVARFNISNEVFFQNDLVRISGSTVEGYNGEWVVSTVGSGYIQVRGGDYIGDATGTITRLDYEFSTEDNVYLFLNIPDYDVDKASANTGLYINQNFRQSVAIAYFSLLNTGRQINTDYKQGLSFGEIQNQLFYQRTILQDYWNTFGRILNDPVKLTSICVLPWEVHNDINFLRPLMIRTKETSNLYYCNVERGYQNSFTQCELELIKLP